MKTSMKWYKKMSNNMLNNHIDLYARTANNKAKYANQYITKIILQLKNNEPIDIAIASYIQMYLDEIIDSLEYIQDCSKEIRKNERNC